MLDLKMRILVVDDFSTMRRILKNILKQIGYTDIDEAEDGNGALAKLRQDKYDLVVSDWNMPNMSGLDLLKAIRADSALNGIPVPCAHGNGRGKEGKRGRGDQGGCQ